MLLLLLGYFLIVTGMLWNILLVRGPLSRKLTPVQIMQTLPWMLSLAMVGVGVLLLILGRQ